jgi:hypothetical protein
MITMQPLPVVDTLNDHGGFYFCCFMAFLFLWMAFLAFEKAGRMFAVCVIVCGLNWGAFQSWTTGTITTPRNEKVIGTLKGFEAEGGAYYERSGKQTVRRQDHRLYVVYQVDGGVVTFSANKGIIYPERVTLYKN